MDTVWIALGLSRPMFLYRGKIDLVGSVAKTGGALECRVGRILSTELCKRASTESLWTLAHDGGNECELKCCVIQAFDRNQQVVQSRVRVGDLARWTGRSYESRLN